MIKKLLQQWLLKDLKTQVHQIHQTNQVMVSELTIQIGQLKEQLQELKQTKGKPKK